MLSCHQRYLLKHLAWPTIAVTFSLTGIIWLTQMLRFVDFMINRGLSVGDFLYLTGLMLPSLLLILLPVSACIATLYTYQKLNGESELVVLSAAGLSPLQLAKPAFMMGGIIMVICYTLGLYLMPISNQKFRDIRTVFRDQYASILLEEEVFNSPVKGLTVYVRTRDNEGNLSGILMHDTRKKGVTTTMLADHGRLASTESGPRFLLQQGLRQEKKLDTGVLSWLSFEEYAVDIGFYAATNARKKEADERTVFNLFNVEGVNPKRVGLMIAESHQRLTWPLFGLVLPLFMVALLQAAEFNRRGQSRRSVFAVICAAISVISFFGIRSASAKTPALLPLLYIWPGVLIAGSTYLLASAKLLPDYVGLASFFFKQHLARLSSNRHAEKSL